MIAGNTKFYTGLTLSFTRTTSSPCSRALQSLYFVAITFSVVFYQGCSEERAVAPTQTQYRLVMITSETLTGSAWAVRVLDLETDSVTTTIPCDIGGRPMGIAVTADGNLAATFLQRGVIALFDLKSSASTFVDYGKPVSSLHFLSLEAGLFVGSPAVYPSAVLDVSSGAVDTVLPEVSRLGFNSPRQDEFVTVTGSKFEPLDGLIRRSIQTWAVIDSFRFISPATRSYIRVEEAEAAPSYDAIYLLAWDEAGYAIFRYSLSDHSCTFRQPLLSSSSESRFAVTPDGREIWVLQNGTLLDPPDGRFYILILDAATGAPVDTIRTVGLWGEYPEYSFPLLALEFHPTEAEVYIAAQSPPPSLFVIDRLRRAIIGGIDVNNVSHIVITPTSNSSARQE